MGKNIQTKLIQNCAILRQSDPNSVAIEEAGRRAVLGLEKSLGQIEEGFVAYLMLINFAVHITTGTRKTNPTL